MTLQQLIEQLRTQQRAQLDQRQAHERTITETYAALNGASPDATQAEALRQARGAITTIDGELSTLAEREAQLRSEHEANERAAAMRNQLVPAGGGDTGAAGGAGGGGPGDGTTRDAARVIREARTYSREANTRGETSFFADSFALTANPGGAFEARARMERHMNEVRVEREANPGMQQRAVATGGFGGLIVPQYLVDMAARVIRAGRPAANIVTGLPLPDQGMSVIVPRGTTGAAAASQATENTGLQNTDEVWQNLSIPVVTIGGQQDVSRQSLERGTPGIDEIVYLDLAGAYHAELDRQVLAGSGASGQMLGILNTTGRFTSTAYGAAADGPGFYRKTAGAIASVAGAGAGIQPRVSVMHPRRWGWLTGLLDGQNRPLVVPSAQGPYNALGINSTPGGYGGDGHGNPSDVAGFTVVGNIQGLPVVTDANVPTNLGTGANEDAEVVFDPSHALLWEDGDGMPRQLRFEQTLGNQLTVKLIAYGYAAFTAGRYPQAFAQVGGTDTTTGNGQIAPTF